MATDRADPLFQASLMAGPSNAHHPNHVNGLKRPPSALDELSVPSNDSNSWYYPSNGFDSEESDLPIGAKDGNWGNKNLKGARWVRKGKMAAWGPGMDDWEAEDRARKRLRPLLPPAKQTRSASPPTLSHRRSPSPPHAGPYPAPSAAHLSYASFVLDKSVAHTFRAHLVADLERTTDGLIQAETAMKQALGRLWQVMSEDPDRVPAALSRTGEAALVPKREEVDDVEADEEEDEEEREKARRIARAPDLTPATHKLFFYPPQPPPPANGPSPTEYEPTYASAPPEVQQDTLEKSLAALREMQDDGREYVERLEEIRDGLGDVRAKRNMVWDVVRRKAIQELQDAALGVSV